MRHPRRQPAQLARQAGSVGGGGSGGGGALQALAPIRPLASGHRRPTRLPGAAGGLKRARLRCSRPAGRLRGPPKPSCPADGNWHPAGQWVGATQAWRAPKPCGPLPGLLHALAAPLSPRRTHRDRAPPRLRVAAPPPPASGRGNARPLPSSRSSRSGLATALGKTIKLPMAWQSLSGAGGIASFAWAGPTAPLGLHASLAASGSPNWRASSARKPPRDRARGSQPGTEALSSRRRCCVTQQGGQAACIGRPAPTPPAPPVAFACAPPRSPAVLGRLPWHFARSRNPIAAGHGPLFAPWHPAAAAAAAAC